MEPILQENKNRFVLFPIVHDDIWNFYKRAEASFWTAEEIDLSQDLTDWGQLNDDERHFLPPQMASLMKIWQKIFCLRFNIQKPSFFTDFK
jgi:ribonucleoside-diphosphate reductase beta chain